MVSAGKSRASTVQGKRISAATRRYGTIVAANKTMERRVPQFNDLSRSLVAFDQNSTEVAVIDEMATYCIPS
jgi:hypothetical protein